MLRRLRRPVISVGNLSVGGTGKTPLVAQIAEWLMARGERPAILSRGYKRRYVEDGVVVVSDGTSMLTDVDRSGDEPLLLARAVPGAIVCVCEERHLAGAIAERVLGATVHVLDDGFQHVQLARDLDILVTSPGEIANGRVLPFGRLREGKDAAARAHVAVFLDSTADAARTEAWDLGISQAVTARRVWAVDESARPTVAIAVAGIGKPDQFFSMLRAASVELKDTMVFADHHRYAPADVARIDAVLRRSGATTVLTTAKDAVRFERLGTLPFTLSVVTLRLAIDDWPALTASLDQAIGRARRVA